MSDSSGGPTEAGSIEARLTLDADQFDAKIREAAAEADRLDNRDVKVKVSANVAEALAAMNAVDIAAGEAQARADAAKAAGFDSSSVLDGVASKYATMGRDTPKAPQMQSVQVDTGGMERARAEAEQLSEAEHKLELAYDSVNRMEQAGIASKSELAAAEARLVAADEELSNIERRLADSTGEVTRAQAEAAATATELAAADGEAAAAGEAEARSAAAQSAAHDKAAAALKGNFTGIQGLIASIPLLVGLVDGLGAALVGTASAFLVMGAAGVLAGLGIEKEMAAGTEAGIQYANGLHTLKDLYDQLAATSAIAMLDSFNSAVSEINSHMPFLNQLTAEMARNLGAIGVTLLDSLITGLEKMQPLLEAGATEFGRFANYLVGWDSGNGFNQFMDIAVASLPKVTDLLENLITLVEHVFQAFFPLTPVLLDITNAFLSMANAIPLPILAGIVTLALEISPAMNLAKVAIAGFAAATGTAAEEVSIFGMSVQLAIPVIGIVLAALSALAIGIASATMGQQQATSAAQDYASALQQDNDAIGKNVDALAAKKLAEDGTITSAEKLGISAQDLIGYLNGNTDAVDRVNTAFNKAKAEINDTSQSYVNIQDGTVTLSDHQQALQHALDQTTKSLSANKTAIDSEKLSIQQAAQATQDQTVQAQANAAALQSVSKQYGVTTQDIIKSVDAHHDAEIAAGFESAAIQVLADKYGLSVGQIQADIAAQQDAQGTFDQTTLKMQEQNNAAGLLKQAWDALNGKQLSAAEAQNRLDSALVNMGDHVDKVGKKITFTTTSIEDQSAASVALRGQLIGQVQDAEKVIEANGNLDQSTEEAKAEYAQLKQSIIDNAVAHGVNRDAAQAYIDKIFQIPTSVKTQAEVDKDQAEAALASLQAQIDNMHGKVIDMSVRYSTEGTAPGPASGGVLMTPQATGGPVGSGVAHAMAHLATGYDPAMRWGTDTIPTLLTKGEEVLPVGAAESLRRDYPGALDYMRTHGALPPQGGQPIIVRPQVHVYVGNRELDAHTVRVVQSEIGAAFRAAAGVPQG